MEALQTRGQRLYWGGLPPVEALDPGCTSLERLGGAVKAFQALGDERPVHAKAPGHGTEVRQVNFIKPRNFRTPRSARPLQHARVLVVQRASVTRLEHPSCGVPGNRRRSQDRKGRES
jgi:hypothetical protein